jgi:hypothetical protein
MWLPHQNTTRIASTYTQGHSMLDVLAGGVRIGIIASSDHGQTHQTRAGVYVDDVPVVIEIDSTLQPPNGAFRAHYLTWSELAPMLTLAFARNRTGL